MSALAAVHAEKMRMLNTRIFSADYSLIFKVINWHAHKCMKQAAADMHLKKWLISWKIVRVWSGQGMCFYLVSYPIKDRLQLQEAGSRLSQDRDRLKGGP